MGSVSIHQIIFVCLRDRRLNDLFFFFAVIVFVCRKAAKHTANNKNKKKLISYKCHLLRKQMNILMTCDNLTVVCLYIDLYYTTSFTIFYSICSSAYFKTVYIHVLFLLFCNACVCVCVCLLGIICRKIRPIRTVSSTHIIFIIFSRLLMLLMPEKIYISYRLG